MVDGGQRFGLLRTAGLSRPGLSGIRDPSRGQGWPIDGGVRLTGSKDRLISRTPLDERRIVGQAGWNCCRPRAGGRSCRSGRGSPHLLLRAGASCPTGDSVQGIIFGRIWRAGWRRMTASGETE